MISNNFKYSLLINFSSIINIGSMIGVLYLIDFPNKRFIPLNIFFNLLTCCYLNFFNLRKIFNFSEYIRDFFPFYLTCNIYLSNHLIFIYLLTIICGSKCSSFSETQYVPILMGTSLLYCCLSGLIKNNISNIQSRIEPINLIEIVVQPTVRDQKIMFMEKIKGEIYNRDISQGEEMVKEILVNIINNIYQEVQKGDKKENEGDEKEDKKGDEKDDLCSICISSLKCFQKRIELECKHQYHFDCLYNCYQNRFHNCPLCRRRYLKD